jgi:hypothetical protein
VPQGAPKRCRLILGNFDSSEKSRCTLEAVAG